MPALRAIEGLGTEVEVLHPEPGESDRRRAPGPDAGGVQARADALPEASRIDIQVHLTAHARFGVGETTPADHGDSDRKALPLGEEDRVIRRTEVLVPPLPTTRRRDRISQFIVTDDAMVVVGTRPGVKVSDHHQVARAGPADRRRRIRHALYDELAIPVVGRSASSPVDGRHRLLLAPPPRGRGPTRPGRRPRTACAGPLRPVPSEAADSRGTARREAYVTAVSRL